MVQKSRLIEKMAELINSVGVKPEIEVFDTGQIRLARDLIDKGFLKLPAMFQLCLGISWTAPATTDAMLLMRNMLPKDTVWAAFGGRRGKEDNVLANPTAQADGTLSAYRFDNAREDTVWSGDIGVRADVTTGPVGHRLVASASQVQSKSRNAYAFSNFGGFANNLYDPVFVAPPAPDFFVGGDLDDPGVTERVKTSSVAVADMLSLFDGRLLATVGARYQEIETKSYDYNTGALGSSYSSDAITPAFALVYKPSEAISLYANYAEALVPGTTAPAVVNGVPVVNAGEVLEPYRAEQMEVGAKYDAGSFGGTLSVFRTTLPSAYFDADTAIYSDGGEQENQGVELTVFGEPVTGLRLIGGATWLDTEINQSLNPALEGKSAIGVPDIASMMRVVVAPAPAATEPSQQPKRRDRPVAALLGGLKRA